MNIPEVRERAASAVAVVLERRVHEILHSRSLVEEFGMDDIEKLDVIHLLSKTFKSESGVELDDEGICRLVKLDDFVWFTLENIIPNRLVDGSILTEADIEKMVLEAVKSCSSKDKISVDLSSPLKELKKVGVDMDQLIIELSDRLKPFFMYPKKSLMKKWQCLKDVIDFATACWKRRTADKSFL